MLLREGKRGSFWLTVGGDTIHDHGEGKATGEGGSCSQCKCQQETNRNELWCLTSTLFWVWELSPRSVAQTWGESSHLS